MIAIFPSRTHKQSKEITQRVIDILKRFGKEVCMDPMYAKEFKVANIEEVKIGDLSLIISMGGDGSLMRRFHQYHQFKAPFLGINLGHLGFMADIPIHDIESGLEEYLKGNYTISKRGVFEVLNHKNNKVLALNDLVIHRSSVASIIELAIYADGVHVNTYQADGIVIATPTGSTAYSLAAGGPILHPTLDALVITPICAHTVSNRPIILHSSTTLTITYRSSYDDPIEVLADGVVVCKLQQNDSVELKRSSISFDLINIAGKDFFSTLRSKLGWVGKLR